MKKFENEEFQVIDSEKMFLCIMETYFIIGQQNDKETKVHYGLINEVLSDGPTVKITDMSHPESN